MADLQIEFEAEPGAPQSEERFRVRFADGRSDVMRIQDYDRVYAVPGLYEAVVQDALQCASPRTTAEELVDAARRAGKDPAQMRVLDLGAGNGVVAGELWRLGVRTIFGVDGVEQAASAAARDHGEHYVDYYVDDLTDPTRMRDVAIEHGIDAISCAGALGGGHVPAAGFFSVWGALPAGGLLAATARPAAPDAPEDSADAFDRLVADAQGEGGGSELLVRRPFRHRLLAAGGEVTYEVVVARRR